MPADPFDRLRALCLALPEATEEVRSGAMTAFCVRGKVFAWYLEDHHGDGRVALWCKAPPGAQAALAGSEPARFFVPPYVGQHGWVGVWLDVAPDTIDWDELGDIVAESYRLVAPKRLAALSRREERAPSIALPRRGVCPGSRPHGSPESSRPRSEM